MLALSGFGTGGFLSVGDVCGYLCGGCHLYYTSERSPWGRATDLHLAWWFEAAWEEWLYRVQRKGTIYFAEA
jgi:hypothetical protein